jgi:hypothetical protein
MCPPCRHDNAFSARSGRRSSRRFRKLTVKLTGRDLRNLSSSTNSSEFLLDFFVHKTQGIPIIIRMASNIVDFRQFRTARFQQLIGRIFLNENQKNFTFFGLFA